MSDLTDPVSLEFVGAQMRLMQADLRTVRSEVGMMRREFDSIRHEVRDAERALMDRMAAFEARVETRFDQMQSETVRLLEQIVQTLNKP